MNHPIQIFEFESSRGLLPLAQISADIAEVADRFDLRLVHWEEEGLGPARGALVKSATFHVFRLREIIHVREYYGVKFAVDADARDLASSGSAELIDDVVRLLGIDKSQVDWATGEEGQRLALKILHREPVDGNRDGQKARW